MAKQQILHCSFCGRSRDEVKILIAGQDGHICENCVEHAQDIHWPFLNNIRSKVGYIMINISMQGITAYALVLNCVFVKFFSKIHFSNLYEQR